MAPDDPHLWPRIAAQADKRLRLLIETGITIASERCLDNIVDFALGAGLRLSGAAFGAFFYRRVGADGEAYEQYKLSGIDEARFGAIPAPLTSALFSPSTRGESIVRSDDVTQDRRFRQQLEGSSDGRPIRSYLAVPVRSPTGEVLGGLLYAHSDAGIFDDEVESLAATVAAQAAAAMETARLTEFLQTEIALLDAVRAEQRETSRRLHQALEAAQLGTWHWHADTGLIDFDERAAALFGVQAHTPISRDRLRERILHRDDLGQTPDDLRAVLRSGGQYKAEYRVSALDGVERWIATSGIAHLAENSGEILGLAGTVQDITERKAQEQSLRTSEKLAATGRLAATIAHEINNPLEAVTNLIYLAKTDPSTPLPVARLLETADAELGRIAQLAQQTLGFYRDTTRPVTIDMNQLLNEVVELFARKLRSRRVQCTMELDPGLSVVGLQGEIRQIISNLLVNAIDASLSIGGNIRIRGRHRRRDGTPGIAVMIMDQGSGIPHHVRKRVFTPFVTTKESTGTGLGLWVTLGMVEKHGGSVRFRTRTEAPSGTVFRVYLPHSGLPQRFPSQRAAVLQ